MAIRQYIGARYVPRFVGTYDPTQIYDALDVVDNGSGTSYIARKTVPAGTPLTDNSFWFIYGASSGAIIQLQTDVAALQNDMASLQAVLGHRMIVIGDSYATRTNGAGKTYNDIIKDQLGFASGDFYEAHANGALFGGGSFLGLLNGLTVTDPDTITDIVVIGGANDATLNDAAQTLAAIQTFCTTAKASYPNARVILFPCGLTFTTDAMTKAKTVYDSWEKAQQVGAEYVENAKYVLRNSTLLDTDKCHPVAAGVDAIANSFINWFVTGSLNVDYELTINAGETTPAIPSNPQTLTAGGSFRMRRHNGTVQLMTTGGYGFNFTKAGSGIQIASNERITLALPRTLWVGTNANETYGGSCGATIGKTYVNAYTMQVPGTGNSVLSMWFPTGMPSSDNATSIYVYPSMAILD